MTIYFEDESDYQLDFSPEAQLKQLIVCAAEDMGCPYELEVSVTMVTKEAIHEMNRQYRQVDRATDVLSFPMMEYDSPADFSGKSFMDTLSVSPETKELILGDIVLCPEVIHEQAEEYGHSERREFSFLVIHSMLHLFGYDHIQEDERSEMERVQKRIMEQLKIYR